MTVAAEQNPTKSQAQHDESVDVVIIGAGLSGIGAAIHLQKQCPQLSVLILEGRKDLGGTWDLFRYPGIRSDSDMYTLGYNFKPWVKKHGIAAGDDIKSYIQQAADEHHIFSKVRFNHQVDSANWCNKTNKWQLKINNADDCNQQIDAKFMLCCTGYYDYKQAYQPQFTGQENFSGDIVHPQFWDEDYDYSGKKIVVIGSGATAVTLVPALAEKAQLVTMLQRSPGYVMTLPQDDAMVDALRKLLPETWVYRITRARNISVSWLIYNYCRRFPERARKLIYKLTQKQLPAGYDMSHFSPDYAPWDERLCAVPDGDLFKSIREQKACVVTDQIEAIEAAGIRLKSGQFIEADLIVTATGLKVQLFGGMQLSIDGQAYDCSDKMIYRGLMLEGLPNAGMVFGYTNASWTLKSDLISKWLCRLLDYMGQHKIAKVSPQNFDQSVDQRPFVDMSSGYIQRALAEVPKQGSKLPWKLYQNYLLDLISLKFSRINDKNLQFKRQL